MKYKLYNGDCLEVMKDIPNKSIDMILCDLPYGTTKCKWDIIIPFDELWEQYNRIIKDNGAIVLFGSQPFTSKLICSNIDNYKYDWIWDKKKSPNFRGVKYQPLIPYEIISVFNTTKYNPQMVEGKMRKKGGYPSKNEEQAISRGTEPKTNNLYYPKAILEFSKANNKESGLHPTQKPVALLEYLIKTYTSENETVLDNCMGSGSTGVACMNTNRQFIGIELDKSYFEIAEKRIKEADKNA
jgi:site-specific DNA-methyltransferase (adenine-specific)